MALNVFNLRIIKILTGGVSPLKVNNDECDNLDDEKFTKWKPKEKSLNFQYNKNWSKSL